MKKEISFYEFVGILVPGSVFLYGLDFIVLRGTGSQLFDITKVGETIVFLIAAYAAGHFVQAFGNLLEKLVWWIYGGMPSQWLLRKNRFKESLFDNTLTQKIVDKLEAKYGAGVRDYSRLAYNHIFLEGKSGRIDVFNGNYSLFRGLGIAFLVLAVLSIYQYRFNCLESAIALTPFALMTRRMIRFAKYYATETYRTFYNLQS